MKKTVRSGMTLIEIAIVVMLLGVIFTGIFSTYYSAMKISKEVDPKVGNSKKDIVNCLESIRSTFTRTFYIESQRRLIFVAKTEGLPGERNDRVVFAATTPNSEEVGKPSVREVSFYLKKKDQEKFSLIRREDEMVDDLPLVGGQENVLLDDVKSFQLKYSERGDRWVDEWNSRNQKKIPRLIRIEIIAKSGSQWLKYESLAFPGILFK
jgi:general secretion pathway protein J